MQGNDTAEHQHGYGKQAYGENLPAALADGRAAQLRTWAMCNRMSASLTVLMLALLPLSPYAAGIS